MLCQIAFASGDYAATEQALFEFIQPMPTTTAWKHQAFLLLVDTYIALEDWFQARATAESIFEYVQVESIRLAATAKNWPPSTNASWPN